MKTLTSEIKNEIKEMVYSFFSEECEVELDQLNDGTTILDDLDGDSLLFVELIEMMKKKYDLNIQLQNVGKYLLKNQAETILEVVNTSCLIYQYEDAIAEMSA